MKSQIKKAGALLIFSFVSFSIAIQAQEKTETPSPNVQNNPIQITSQTSVEKQEPILPKDPPKKELPWFETIKFGGMIRIRPEAKYNYDFNRFKNDNVSFVGAKAQIWLEKDISEKTKIRITLQDSALWGGEKGSYSGLDTANDNTRQSVGIREAWIESKELLGPIALQAGRQILKYGDERLVGALDWTNVGRSFNGFRFKLDKDFFSSHAWVMIVGEQDSDIVGNSSSLGKKNSFPAQYNCPANTNTPCKLTADIPKQQQGDSTFTGFYNTIKFSKHLHLDGYYIGLYKKWLPQNNAAILLLSNPETVPRDSRYDQLHTFGFRITNRTTKDKKSESPLDFSFEYSAQTGRTGWNVTPGWDSLNTNVSTMDPLTGQTITKNLYRERQSYDAFAYALDMGYTIGAFRLGAEYDVASGDPNRKDGRVATFSNLFHSNHIFYGEADQVSWVNMIGKSANLTWDGGEMGKLRIAYWIVDKQKLQDGWYDITGTLKEGASTESYSNDRFKNPYIQSEKGAESQRAVGTLGKNLFREIDIVYTLKYKDIVWAMGYSWIFAGDAVRGKVNDTTISPEFRKTSFLPQAQFAYLSMTAQF